MAGNWDRLTRVVLREPDDVVQNETCDRVWSSLLGHKAVSFPTRLSLPTMEQVRDTRIGNPILTFLLPLDFRRIANKVQPSTPKQNPVLRTPRILNPLRNMASHQAPTIPAIQTRLPALPTCKVVIQEDKAHKPIKHLPTSGGLIGR